MLIDGQKLRDKGYKDSDIEAFQTIFDFEDYGITCLSANSADYLPMWAYYTNNHKGFCIEYDVEKKDCIHEVLYEPERIKVASLFFQCADAVKETLRSGKRKQEADFFARIFLQNLFIKAETWKHEKEYRIVYCIEKQDGINVPVNSLGVRAKKNIAGINCSSENVERLNRISNELGLGDVYKSRLHADKYAVELYR